MGILDFLKSKNKEQEKISQTRYTLYDTYSTELRARVTAKSLDHNNGMQSIVKETNDGSWQVLVKS